MAKRKILIVDDEHEIIEYLGSILEDRFDPIKANNGAEAISLFGENNFNLVLTDVRMPGIDGIQVLQTIKKLSPFCEVILMTGFTDCEVVIQALNEGAFAFVTKPITQNLLMERIENAIAVIQSREKKAEVLKEMKQDLLTQTMFAQKLSALAAMAGGIAHELHQPLSGISIYSSTITRMIEKKKEIDPDFLLETMNKINRQVERSTNVIEHMREFSSQKSYDGIERMGLNEAVLRALELFNMQLKAHQIELKVEIPKDLLIELNRNVFEQVIINLVSNSKDSMLKNNSNLESQSSITGNKTVKIIGHKEGAWIMLDIIDTGEGVPDELVDSIFEPFVTGKIKTGGSGLGLFICNKVMEEHGGKIELLSTGKTGTTFRLHFPQK